MNDFRVCFVTFVIVLCAAASFAQPTSAQPRYQILYSWYSESRKDHFATTHPSWRGQIGDERLPDYRLIRIEGLVFSADQPQPPGTVPLFGWYSDRRGDNFITTDPLYCGDSRFCDEARTQHDPDYHFVRVEGFVFDPLRPPPPGTWPLYNWYHPATSHEDNRATTDRRWGATLGAPRRCVGDEGIVRLPCTRPSTGYQFFRREGYVIPRLPQYTDSLVQVPLFFHLVQETTDPRTGLPAHQSGTMRETMLDVDEAIEVANQTLEDTRNMDSRRLQLTRIGVRYVEFDDAVKDSAGCVMPRATIGDAAVSGALNVVLTSSCGSVTISPFELRANAHSLLHEVGHALGLHHPFVGNKDRRFVEPLHRNLDADAEASCYRKGDRVCDTPPDYGYAREDGNLDWVECGAAVPAACRQPGPRCDPAEPVIDSRGVCVSSGSGGTRTYDPISLGLQLGTPNNVMAYHNQDVLTYEQFLRMHGFAQWRRGRQQSVPVDEQWMIRLPAFGDEWIWDGAPDRGQFLHYLRTVQRTERFERARRLRDGVIQEQFYVTPSIGRYVLSVRAEALGTGRPSDNAVLRLESPTGAVVTIRGNRLGRNDGSIIADEIWSTDALARLRGREAPGTWRVWIEDPDGSFAVNTVRLIVHGAERR